MLLPSGEGGGENGGGGGRTGSPGDRRQNKIVAVTNDLCYVSFGWRAG